MALRTPEEYVESLRRLNPVVYIAGERIDNYVDHPLIRPGINVVAQTYAAALDPRYEDLCTAVSHISGEKINRLLHVYQSREDCIRSLRMLRVLNQLVGTCCIRCVTKETINPLYELTYQIDLKRGTNYHARFKKYLSYIQSEDLFCAAGVTDVKGDRARSPSRQADPDLYVRVVKKNSDGIVVRGAKMHMTGVLASHYINVMPTTTMREEDADYAVAFAVPVNAPGLTFVLGRHSMDERRLDGSDLGNLHYDMHEALVIFEDVFIPWERVFMCGEFEFTGLAIELFTAMHRFSYGGCRPGVMDVLIGATRLISEINGVSRASHIRDKLTEMVHLSETIWACGLAAALEGHVLPSGVYCPNRMLANVAKLNVGRFPYEIARLAHEVTGGIIATMPSEKDLLNHEIGPKVEKYLRGVEHVPTWVRMRLVRLIENITLGVTLPADLFGGGGPQTQKIVIEAETNWEHKKRMACEVAGITKLNGSGTP
ncbi:4-hydroxybutyryl-CoA dehydratase [Desulfofundulus sp. TPOSR]|uniref:4-hydroxyphenylacetate 3-hydroxylase family protein n=1 Tax=Desulfofundulus sp. TPOSR TaxID=2714340 RepID=UPI00140E1AC4|nr:4-hydroxyphenylacetate 3-hydroxylase N-terminal domain-containing protein [Desulfofundulus sp. TPOSR]NHM25769.1 4-hydroxybutyryl-CoA dehydratase [Desulfofundulus sp. TPOSR]